MANSLDLTQGSIKKGLLSFAFPLFLGNLFQQLYNTVDSLIVGNFLGPLALASVSSSTPLIFMMIGFFQGVAVGAGVVIAKSFGARDKDSLTKAVYTDLALGLTAGILLSIFGVLFTPSILKLMKTPSDILPNSIEYFRIYSYGLIFSMMYNICNGIMNAIGDSKHPLYYLITSSITNVILDLLFVAVLGFGVWSVALATTLSQALSVVLSFIRLMKGNDLFKVEISKIRFDGKTLKDVIRFGLPAGIQNSVVGFANTVVQTNVNTFTSVAVAGSGAYAKIEGFAFLPITCFALSLTTFIGQNLGAKKYDRAKEGARFAILCSISAAEIIGILVFIFAPFLISLFNDDPEVVAFGTKQCRIEGLFYFALAFSHCIAGILRGSGKATVPMFIMIGIWCVFRVTYLTVVLHFFHYVQIIYSVYPLTWSLSTILFLIYFLKADWIHGLEKKRV
ncbi:MATE family efflux transporter [Spirochaetales bacterium NM-380-WT-3C1]|uniref:Multidrug-efflux transporter n=1 Tax=Bullifex porci TaxID=2606638 RepID=A0A7X2PBQ5_9SPIO|nr:MATE family efflux transporter [Bullifex porci]MSU05922.1 MATE family efflux transporter [Bullifex porci]